MADLVRRTIRVQALVTVLSASEEQARVLAFEGTVEGLVTQIDPARKDVGLTGFAVVSVAPEER